MSSFLQFIKIKKDQHFPEIYPNILWKFWENSGMESEPVGDEDHGVKSDHLVEIKLNKDEGGLTTPTAGANQVWPAGLYLIT